MASGRNRDPISNVDVIEDNDPGYDGDQANIAQFNYREPGMPSSGFDSGDSWDGGVDGSHPRTKTQAGLSERAGMSEPKTLKELDDENTWSSAR